MKETQQDEYSVFYIKGKNNKLRLIQSPSPSLKKKQKELVELYEQFPLHKACCCKKGSGPIDAAQPHLGAKFLLKVDISNCYERIRLDKIEKIISNSDISNNLKQKMINNLQICFIDWNGEYRLPTGAPTSSVLCNIALTEIDYIVNDIALEHNYKYTRYMDDLNLSTTSKERKWELIHTISCILAFSGFPTNIHKTKWFGKGDNDAKIITGINLNTISRRSVKRMVRARLNNLARDKQPLDAKTKGYLSYINSIDKTTYDYFISYHQSRIKFYQDLSN